LVSYVGVLLSGIAMGIANIIPGISGGTVLVILKVYEKFVTALSSFHLKGKGFIFAPEAWKFLIVLGFGALIGVFGFAPVMAFLLARFELFTYLFLIGILLSSLLFVLKSLTTTHKAEVLWVGVGILAFSLVFWASSRVAPYAQTGGGNTLRLFLGGLVGAIFMVLPGISGSMMLIVLGLYEDILFAINHHEPLSIVVIGLGVIAGILISAKVIRYCLNRFRNQTYFFVVGLMLASLVPLWKVNSSHTATDIALGFGFLVLGFLLGYPLSKTSPAKQIEKTHLTS